MDEMVRFTRRLVYPSSPPPHRKDSRLMNGRMFGLEAVEKRTRLIINLKTFPLLLMALGF